MPVEHRRLVAPPLLDDRAVVRRQADALAGGQHVVVEIAAPRHPHPAVEHRQFPVDGIDAHGAAFGHDVGAACLKVRIHHESPVTDNALPMAESSSRAAGESNEMQSAL